MATGVRSAKGGTGDGKVSKAPSGTSASVDGLGVANSARVRSAKGGTGDPSTKKSVDFSSANVQRPHGS